MEVPRIVGRYELHDELACGGMARVCLGKLRADEGFSRVVAVKQLLPHLAAEPEAVVMFIDEAHLVSAIRHPNVVTTLDVVRDGDEVFLVMDYVVGESLAKLLVAAGKRGARAPLPIVAAIMTDLLEGLHAAHQATSELGVPLNVVHRDVSPHNVLVGTDGVTRVVDFGVAKAIGRMQETTRSGQFKGKLAYMAPEQVAGAEVDRRSDVWAAGAVLWELLTGRRLFPDAADALRYHAEQEEIPAPSARGADAAFDVVVEKATARDPQERFQTAREMVAAIEKVVTPAPARQVGQWVQLLAKEALAKRASLLEAIQAVPPAEPRPDARRAQAPIADSAPAPARSTSETPPPVPQPSTPPPPGPSAPGLSATVAAHAGRDPGAPPRRGWLVPVALGALVLFGGGAAAARFAPRPWAAATAPTAAAVELPPPAPTPTVDSPKPPDLHPPASAAATAAEVAGPVTTAPATSGIVRAWGRGRPRTGASASPRASATADALEMDKRK